jgi:hypothetical protein
MCGKQFQYNKSGQQPIYCIECWKKPPFCKCGCGQRVKSPRQKYIYKHSNKGRMKEGYNQKNYVTDEMIQKVRLALHNRIRLPKTFEKISSTLKERYKTNPSLLKGRPLLEEHKRKIGLANAKYCGEKSCNWKGGLSFELYPKNFNKKLKDKMKDRDNHVCQLCGVPEQECILPLKIHHIDYIKENCSEYNLISLCGKCHSKTNANRPYWTTYFTNLIKNKYEVINNEQLVCR